MRVLEVRNVNDALAKGLAHVLEHGVREESRNGPVIVAPWPVTTAYERPTERVLFSPERDANPFFHLVESAWMLAGRDDGGALTPYVARFKDYAEDGGYLHGAYGNRWRNWFGYDQLEVVAQALRRDPTTRQAVIAMWDATEDREDEPTTGADDLRGTWRDRPCNTHCYVRVRYEKTADFRSEPGDASGGAHHATYQPVLDLTVMCRSNDLIWGAYGANAVHFSYLLEWLAVRAGVGVGRMFQVSNNLHCYLATLEPLLAKIGGLPERLCYDAYARDTIEPYPMTVAPHVAELQSLWLYIDELHKTPLKMLRSEGVMTTEELSRVRDAYAAGASLPAGVSVDNVALPLPPATQRWTTFSWDVARAARAHALYRGGQLDEALNAAGGVTSTDWRTACVEWLKRRRKT